MRYVGINCTDVCASPAESYLYSYNVMDARRKALLTSMEQRNFLRE